MCARVCVCVCVCVREREREREETVKHMISKRSKIYERNTRIDMTTENCTND